MTLIGRDGAEEITVDDLAALGGHGQLRDPVRHLEARSAHLRDAPARSGGMTRRSVSQADEAPPEVTAPSRVGCAPGRGLTPACAPMRVILELLRRSRALAVAMRSRALFRRPFRLRLFLEQMHFVGVGSLPIIVLVGFFSGAVSAQQAITALRIFNQERFVGATVGISLAQELAPVFTGADDHRARRLGHGHRARLDAHHRADRRAHHVRRRSDSVPDHAA